MLIALVFPLGHFGLLEKTLNLSYALPPGCLCPGTYQQAGSHPPPPNAPGLQYGASLLPAPPGIPELSCGGLDPSGRKPSVIAGLGEGPPLTMLGRAVALPLSPPSRLTPMTGSTLNFWPKMLPVFEMSFSPCSPPASHLQPLRCRHVLKGVQVIALHGNLDFFVGLFPSVQ